jgi:hypothetical protein
MFVIDGLVVYFCHTLLSYVHLRAYLRDPGESAAVLEYLVRVSAKADYECVSLGLESGTAEVKPFLESSCVAVSRSEKSKLIFISECEFQVAALKVRVKYHRWVLHVQVQTDRRVRELIKLCIQHWS